jgi:Fe-S oxidoreductase
MARELAEAGPRLTAGALCLECGKCSAVCPLTRENPGFSPRRIVLSANRQQSPGKAIWACLTCLRCDSVCPLDIHYADLLRELRVRARGHGERAPCSHGGIFAALSRIMATPDLKQDRLHWIADDVKWRRAGPDVFFVGCAPFYNEVFTHLGVRTIESMNAALRLLNRLGIEPAILAQERCCGHDAFWAGDLETFTSLATLNVELLQQAGAERVIFPCADCFSAFRQEIRAALGEFPFETVSLVSLLAERRSELGAARLERKVTFQDPCKLCRGCGIADEPRTLLQDVEGLELREMDRSREAAVCCGGSWNHCDRFSRLLQGRRMREARRTGSDALVTACPRCAIHLSCAQYGLDGDGDSDERIAIVDLYELLEEALT